MTWTQHLVEMAMYNCWMNQRMLECTKTLSEEAQKQELGAFFGSIFATWNHLLVANRIWLKRYQGFL